MCLPTASSFFFFTLSNCSAHIPPLPLKVLIRSRLDQSTEETLDLKVQ